MIGLAIVHKFDHLKHEVTMFTNKGKLPVYGGLPFY